ncbi:TPA: hypothetical protein ACGNVG_002180 [Streptococcus agalactiae]
MIELSRGHYLDKEVTLEELAKMTNMSFPDIIFGRPQTYLNETLYDWCEWLRFMDYACQLEKDRSISREDQMWDEIWEKANVIFYDYTNNIAYLEERV